MIIKNRKNIWFIAKGRSAINKVYKGAMLVWESIIGCFTRGYWLNDKRWTNDKGWKNN